MLACALCLVMSVSDQFWVAIEDGFITNGIIFKRYYINAIYNISGILACFCWFLYAAYCMDLKWCCSHRGKLILSILPAISVVLNLLAPMTGWIFSINYDGSYERGPLYIVSFIVPFLYLLSASVIAIQKIIFSQNIVDREQYFPIAIYFFPPLTCIMLQVIFSEVPLDCIGGTIGFIIVYMANQSMSIQIDPLTGLNNRNLFYPYLLDQLNNDENYGGKLSLLMIDMDHMKQINDHYGHLEGDRALQRTADALKSVGKNHKCFIGRFGGDEFCIITRIKEEAELLEIKKVVDLALQEQVIKYKIPYEFTASIGWAIYNPVTMKKNTEALIDEADKMMYQAKAARGGDLRE